MRIAVLGIGGVGGYVGARLAVKEGRPYEVLFIARGNHLQKIKEHGLIVKQDNDEFIAIPDLATDNTEDIGKVDLLILATKGYDLEDASKQVKPLVSKHTIILPLMNGVDHFIFLESMYPNNLVVEACIYIFSYIENPGVIRETGNRCKIVMGKNADCLDKLKPIENMFSAAGIPTILQDDPSVAIWSKFLLISSLACTTSLFNQEVGVIMKDSQKLQFYENILEEAEAVARAKGIKLPPDVKKKTITLVQSMPFDAKTSMQRDFEKGNRNELEALCGAVIRIGKELGVPTPLYEEVYRQLKNKSIKA